MRKVLLVFRADIPATTITVADVAGQITGGNPTGQNENASGDAVPLVVLAAYGSSGSVNPRTFSPMEDGEVQNQPGSSPNSVLAWKIYNSSPADVISGQR